jgi:hypothetical protein
MDASPHFGIIRVLKIGLDPRDSMTHTVGQVQTVLNDDLKIVDITVDRFNSENFSVITFNVFAERNGKQFLWKQYMNQPYSIEYFLPHETTK